MSLIFQEFEDNIIKKLLKEGLIAKYVKDEFSEVLNSEFIVRAFENSTKISYDEYGLYIFDEKGDKLYCPKKQVSIDVKGCWLSDSLPDINFDIDQSGNVRKADEVEALYCCVNVAHIMNEEIFKKEVRRISLNYDFDNMAPLGKGENFRELINSWQTLQSTIINIIISACKYKLSYKKKNSEKFLRDGLSIVEVAGLRDLESRIKNINSTYAKRASEFNNETTRITKIQLIDERNLAISGIISGSSYGDLYRLMNLSTEFISPVKKLNLQNWIKNTIDADIEKAGEKEKTLLISERSQMLSRLNKKVMKIERISVIRQNIEKFTKDRKNFQFPSKL